MTRSCLFHASNIDCLNFRKPAPPMSYDNKWLDSKFGRLRYVAAGGSQSPGVVLMPDPPNTIEQMAPLIEMLSRDFTVIAFDAPGFGYSRVNGNYNYSLVHNAAIIAEIIEKNSIAPAILAMTCVGALSAIQLAKVRPELVCGLVLGQAPSIEESKRWASRVDVGGLLGTPYVGQVMLKLARKQVAKKWYENAFPKGYDSSAHSRQTLDSFKRGAAFSLASAFQALNAEDTKSPDMLVETNAVVLWGMLDRTHRKTNIHSIMDCLPNGRLVELAGAGHFPDIEAPNLFLDAVRAVSNAHNPNAVSL